MILVTGASGFIGSHLCAELKHRRVPFVTAGRQVAPNGFVVGDLGADVNWGHALAGVETVIHMAARVHVMRDRETDPLGVFRSVNTAGTLRLANSAADAGVRRFVFLSSIKVNGEGTPVNGAYRYSDPPRPVDPYGISKLETEHGLRELARRRNLEVVIVRPPLVYGPGVKANFLQLLRHVHRGLPLPLASVQNRRSFVFVANLVDLLLTCAMLPAAAGQTFLASDGEDLSTPDLITRISRAMEKPSRLWPFPPALLALAASAVGRRAAAERLLGSLRVDIDHTRQTLSWSPPISADAGLEATARAFVASL